MSGVLPGLHPGQGTSDALGLYHLEISHQSLCLLHHLAAVHRRVARALNEERRHVPDDGLPLAGVQLLVHDDDPAQGKRRREDAAELPLLFLEPKRRIRVGEDNDNEVFWSLGGHVNTCGQQLREHLP